ncbi:IQ domain-containing protein F3 [Perognathus longimembris pacificus]|uniref:IQ domain-containing protein F3 n=1 Tax=Perognathus longimembris pacificus TaxID=214514 RepID=UPI0020192C56|nr:IQ domain-containing protein F3 [Perognathus longimembris pacificus]
MGKIYCKPKPKDAPKKTMIVKPPARTTLCKILAARKIQAWWRGVLVRRVLLVAALRAWMIQSWWRAAMFRRASSQRQALLRVYAVEEGAAVKLQACVRMWLCRQYFCRLGHALYMLQSANEGLFFRKEDPWSVPDDVAAREPEFHIEIVCV